MTDDIELLRLYAKHRSEDAFAELVRRHVDLVYGVALRTLNGDAHLAQDVAQQVFVDLARKAGELSRRPVIGGWLYRSAQFAASKVVRSERRRRGREEEAATMMAPESEPDWDKLRPTLDRLMGELGDEDRDAVWLRVVAGRPFAEVGQRLGLGENAARMRVERALDKLQKGLARLGVTSSALAISSALAAPASPAPVGLAGRIAVAVPAGAVLPGGLLTGAAVAGGVAMFFLVGLLLGGAARMTLPTPAKPQSRVSTWIRGAGETIGLVQPRNSTELAPVEVGEVLPGVSQILREAGLHPASDDPPDNRPSWLYIGVGSRRTDLLKSPTYLAARTETLRLQYETTLGPLFAKMGLDASRQERIRDILIERAQAFGEGGGNMSNPILRARAQAESDSVYYARLRPLINAPDWEEFERAIRHSSNERITDRVVQEARNQIGRAATTMELMRAPLTEPQREELEAAWVESRRNGTSLPMPASLSPEQVRALQRRDEISRASSRLKELMEAAAEARDPGQAARQATAMATFEAKRKAEEEAEAKAALEK